MDFERNWFYWRKFTLVVGVLCRTSFTSTNFFLYFFLSYATVAPPSTAIDLNSNVKRNPLSNKYEG